MFKTTKAEMFVMQEKLIDSVYYLNKLYELSKRPQSMAWDGEKKIFTSDIILSTGDIKIFGDKFKFTMLFVFNQDKREYCAYPELVKITNLLDGG
jgi:hypothetical protein